MVFILLPLAIAGISMAPWVPTRKRDIVRLTEILDLKKWQKFFEIGCGDGRVSEAVAKAFPSAKILGCELAYPMFVIAYIRKIFFWSQNYSLTLANAFKKDFGEYDVIYVYGMPDKMWAKIVPKFLDEAKSWAKLYSYVFSIPTTPPNLPLIRGGKEQDYGLAVISHGWENEAKIHVLEKK